MLAPPARHKHGVARQMRHRWSGDSRRTLAIILTDLSRGTQVNLIYTSSDDVHMAICPTDSLSLFMKYVNTFIMSLHGVRKGSFPQAPRLKLESTGYSVASDS